jgi:hypothetical protein
VLREEWRKYLKAYDAFPAFPKLAYEENLGDPIGSEYTVTVDGKEYVFQHFLGGIIYAEKGKWGEAHAIYRASREAKGLEKDNIEVVDLRGQLPTRPGTSYYKRPAEDIMGVTIHYTASPPRSGVEAVRMIAEFHVGLLASKPQEEFPAIAYHLVVDASGTIYLCNDLDTRTWHNAAVVEGLKRNRTHIGLAYISNREPSPEVIDALVRAVFYCEQSLGRNLYVEGHKDHYRTECPWHWEEWRNKIYARL